MSKIEIPPPHPAISRANDELSRLEMFVNICVRALDRSAQAVKMIEVTQRLAKQANFSRHIMSEEKLAKVKEQAGEFEAFAREQKEDGFPFLFSLAVVRLWSILEALVDDLAVDFLRRPNECKDKDLIYSLKGPLLEFATAPPERQADFLTERLKDVVKAGLQPGVGRFEAILDPIGLGGGIDSDVRRVLFEISQVRNVIVHKAGITDQRFIEACSWLNLKSGAPLKVNAQDFHLYTISSYYYVVEIRYRIHQFLGYEKPQDIRELLNETGDIIRNLWSQRAEPDKSLALLTTDS
jgi:hypothetical protein